MTRDSEDRYVERRLVVVFDICSSTTILEDLKQTDNLAHWRNLLIALKDQLGSSNDSLHLEPYKFIGDGWVLLFPESVPRDELCQFLSGLSLWFQGEFDQNISGILSHRPDPVGLMFGVDAGELIRLEMNEKLEYLGRAINVAARLQAKTKELPGGPGYKALFSKNSFSARYPSPPSLRFEPKRVRLRNIGHGTEYECLLLDTFGRPPSLAGAFQIGNGRAEAGAATPEGGVGVKDSDPRVYVDVKVLRESLYSKTPFVLDNQGGGVAHNVAIQPIKLKACKVAFEVVGAIAPGSNAKVLPCVEPASAVVQHDIVQCLKSDSDSNGELLETWPVSVCVVYENFAGDRIETSLDLVYEPIKDIMLTNHPSLRKEDTTVLRAQNYKFRRLPAPKSAP